MSAVIFETTAVPEIADGMLVQVIYKGQQKIRYRFVDAQGRSVVPEWWDEDKGEWVEHATVCTEPYADVRGKPKVVYDGLPYVLEVGNERCWMPIEAARSWFGDERSTEAMDTGLSRKGIRSWVNDRPTEVRRLRCLYDNRMGDENVIIGYPVVEVYTLEGERVPMVLDDPMGVNSTPAKMTVADNDHLHMLIAKQQAQLDQMRRQIEANAPSSQRPRAPKATKREDDEEPEERTVPIDQLPEDPGG
jgi:hypothetical protein